MVTKTKRELSRSIVTKITKGGQITLPAEARAALGVKPGDSVYVRIEGDEVSVIKPKYSVKDLKGILQPPRADFDIEDAIREAKEEMADDAVRKMQIGRG